MTERKSDAKLISGLLAKLKSSGEAAFEELSNELMENELFLAAMKKSLEAKAHVDKTVSGTMDFISLPSKNDVTKVLEEIQAVRSRLVKQQRILKNLEQSVAELKELLLQRPAQQVSMPTLRIESMSSVDSAWLHMDSPANLMMVSGILVFDGTLEMDRLRQVVERRLLRFDRFRQRVVESRGLLPGCRWEPDPEFDLKRRLVREDLPSPRDEAALQTLVSRLISEPLDPEHPLWQFHLIDDYQGGSALIARLHHCIGDGIALTYALLSLTDDTPDAPAEKEFPAGTDEVCSDLDLDALGRRAGRGVGRAANVTSDFLTHPDKMQQAMAGLSATTAALGKLMLMPADPRTPFKGSLAVEKRAVWSRAIDLDRIKLVGRKTGSTVNDLVLAAVSGALRRYLVGRGHDVEGLDIRAVVPVNLRRPEEAHKLGNQFGLVFLALPLGIEDTLDRVFELNKRMDSIKDSPEAQVAFQILRGMGMAPRQVYERILRMFGKKATAVMTNVKGPTAPIYFGGAPIRQMMGFVPRSAGLGMGVSILSYDGEVLLGITTDAGLVPDPERILDGFYAELDELLDLVRMVE